MILYGNFLFNVGHMDSWWQSKVGVVITDGIPRAAAGISMGIFIRLLVDIYKKFGLKINKYVSRICVWTSVVIVAYFTFIKAWSILDFIDIFLFSIILFLNGTDENYLNFTWIQYLNDITFFVYLMQVVAIHTVLYVFGTFTNVVQIIVAIILDFILANILLLVKMTRRISHERR